MENVYGSWEGYMDRLKRFEKSGEGEALFPLPNGKTMGEATAEEIAEFRAYWEDHHGVTRDESELSKPGS